MRQFITALSSGGGQIVPPINFQPSELFVMWNGQSNAKGTGGNTPPVGLQSAITGANIYDPNTTTYDTLEYGVNSMTVGNYPNFSGLLSFAKNWKDNALCDMYIEKPAIGGTSINPAASASITWAPSADTLINDFRDAQTRLKAKAAAIGSVSPKYVLVWNQGENDKTASQVDYLNWFETMLADIETIHPYDLVIINTISTLSTGYGAGVKAAHLQWVSENSSRGLSIDLTPYDLLGDNLHFNATGYEDIGDETYLQVKNFYLL